MDAAVGRRDFDRWGPVSVDAIRSLHTPVDRSRVSHSSFPRGTTFGGTALASRRYVLSGACVYIVGQTNWELHAGDIADIPRGDYQFRVLGSGPVKVVSVWELPTGL